MRPRPGLPLALAVALLASLAVAPAAMGSFLKGIDVSNHQERISWGEVPERIRFTFLKASESTGFVDAYYDRNRKLAKRNGIRVGAYHFGDPEGNYQRAARRDGRREARFFHAVAQPRRGELLPVLDLEVTGGLPPGRLKAWAMAYMRTLDGLVPGKPMIYTSPNFWQTAMDDTKWFAREGYKALWIAHWETDRPSVRPTTGPARAGPSGSTRAAAPSRASAAAWTRTTTATSPSTASRFPDLRAAGAATSARRAPP